MKTVIMAGGKGTRISSVTANIPKPMIPIGGKPVLEHEMECLKKQGFTDIIITISHLGEYIKDYFGDGSRFGIHIDYYYEESPLGNAGALFKLKDKLREDFLLINGDVVFDIDVNRFVEFHREHDGLVTIFTHPNDHPYDSGLILADQRGAVTGWITKEEERPKWYKNRVNAGIHIVSPYILEMPMNEQKVDLDRHLLKPLAGTGKMFCYDSSEYVKDMGTPERYSSVCNDFLCGMVEAKNLEKKQRAIFLDRDGTINRHIGFLREEDEFELLPKVGEAIRKINQLGYLVVVVTNQPVIARGEVSWEKLKHIHDKMETLLGYEGAYVDKIYVCPHHPHSGFEGEIKEYKMECGCRKPKPGMLLKAASDMNIDLTQSWMVGDSESDIKAGLSAGCLTALVGDAENCGQVVKTKSLLEFVELYLLKGEKA